MSSRRNFIVAAALSLALGDLSRGAAAQDWKANWDKTLAEARGQKLNIALQPDPGFDAVVEEFKKKFPFINVVASNENPSALAPRIVTEQKNGLYVWDVWWSTASNMTAVNIPANSLEKIPDYLILPEVTDPANWQDPRYIYTSDKGPYVFVHTHYLQNLAYYNTDLVPVKELKSVADMLNPTLRGKIALRAPDRPHGGTQMMAAMLKREGEDFVVKLFNDQKPTVVDNARQVTDGVIRGDFAIGIGTDDNSYRECLAAGGCKNVKKVPINYMHSRAISIPKNPPNKAATKVFVNWLLSKDGQETYVRVWDKVDEPSQAFSMRKDVVAGPRSKEGQPDFSNLDQYVAVSLDSGVAVMDKVSALFAKSRAK